MTDEEVLQQMYKFQSSTSRHGGTDLDGYGPVTFTHWFQSSTSRHGGTDREM